MIDETTKQRLKLLKLPKIKLELLRMLDEERELGYQDGRMAGLRSRTEEIEKLKATLASRHHRVEALKVLTHYCSATGQTMSEFAKAMSSEAD